VSSVHIPYSKSPVSSVRSSYPYPKFCKFCKTSIHSIDSSESSWCKAAGSRHGHSRQNNNNRGHRDIARFKDNEDPKVLFQWTSSCEALVNEKYITSNQELSLISLDRLDGVLHRAFI